MFGSCEHMFDKNISRDSEKKIIFAEKNATFESNRWQMLVWRAWRHTLRHDGQLGWVSVLLSGDHFGHVYGCASLSSADPLERTRQ